MNIIVVGCGKIGTNIIASLVEEGHNVVAIDDTSAVISEINNVYDVMGVCGNGANCEVLEEAGVEKANLFIAVTGSDELNMVSCFIARKMGAKHTIARVRNPEFSESGVSFMCQQLDISMIVNPEQLAAQELFNILKFPSAVKIETFSRRNFELIELKLSENSQLAGMKVNEIRQKHKANFLICVVLRGDKMYIPDGNFVLQSGDKIGLTASPAEMQKLLKSIGLFKKQARSVMIMGGSKTAYYLAKKLLASGNSVKIIEKDRERCHELCDLLPKAVVINGDGAKQELLLEEGLESMDAFVALTGMDEENILISMFAASYNTPKVIPKVNRSELFPLAQNLGLDSVVSPKETTSNVLLRYARALQNSLGSNVETLYKLMGGKTEALEFNVRPEWKHTGIPIRELRLRSGILISGIIRGRKTIIPTGDDVILAGDRVVVITSEHGLKDLSDIIK